MGFKLGRASREKLKGVHPDLVKVMQRAIEITPIDFRIIEGPRTVARQRHLVAIRASRTMNSRHIPGSDGFAKAVDIVPLDGGKPRFDWPLYYRLAPAVKRAAKELKIPLEWGGDWKSFKDGPHFQLPHKSYP